MKPHKPDRLVDLVFSHEQIAAAHVRVQEQREAARMAYLQQRELHKAMSEAERRYQAALDERQLLDAEAAATFEEAKALGLTKSRTWAELDFAWMQSQATALET